MTRNKRRLERLILPGQDGRTMLLRLALLLGALWLISLFFFQIFLEERDVLIAYGNQHSRAVDSLHLDGGFLMAPFWSLAKPYLLPLCYAAPVYLVFGVVRNYRLCHDGARSDYTLRRLGSAWEYHRRCLALPMAGALACLLLFALLLALYYAIYLYVTPPELLLPATDRFWGLGVEPCYC